MTTPFWDGFEKQANFLEQALHYGQQAMANPMVRRAGAHAAVGAGVGALQGALSGAPTANGQSPGLGARVGRAVGHGVAGGALAGAGSLGVQKAVANPTLRGFAQRAMNTVRPPQLGPTQHLPTVG